MMKEKFIVRFILIVLVFVIIGTISIVITSGIVSSRDFMTHQTKSNLLPMKAIQSYDLAFVGPSHARMFSKLGNHPKVEMILDKKIINLGKGDSRCSIKEQLFYLQYAYSQDIEIDTILLLISPGYYLSEQVNYASNTFTDEPFRFDFFFQYLLFSAENKYERLFFYIQTKFTLKWLRTQPDLTSKDTVVLKFEHHIPWKKIMESKTLQEGDTAIMARNSNTFEEIIRTAKAHNTELIFIIPPVLYNRHGHLETLQFLEHMKSKHGTKYFDLSESIDNINLFSNLDHLNTEGILEFSEKFLIPIVNPGAKPSSNSESK